MEKWKAQEIGLIKFQVSCFSYEAWDFIWKKETELSNCAAVFRTLTTLDT